MFSDDLLNFLKAQDLPKNVWDKITHQNAQRLVPLPKGKS
jgi:hypothetical protein